MTSLVDWQIYDALNRREIIIEPFDPYALQSGSVDLRLADKLVDPADGTVIIIPAEGLEIRQGDFFLGCTEEIITVCPYIKGDLRGKSTIARNGLTVEAAGLVDQGFSGQLTLEIFNVCRKAYRVFAGMHITQITFERTMQVQYPYGTDRGPSSNHYQGQLGPTLPYNSHLYATEEIVPAEVIPVIQGVARVG